MTTKPQDTDLLSTGDAETTRPVGAPRKIVGAKPITARVSAKEYEIALRLGGGKNASEGVRIALQRAELPDDAADKHAAIEK